MKKPVNVMLMACIVSIALISCNKDEIGDYLPLNVGARYLYEYDGGYQSSSVLYHKVGECELTITSLNTDVDTVNVYTVQEIFNGIMVSQLPEWMGGTQDTTIIENEITVGTIKEYKGGKIRFEVRNIPGGTYAYFERYHESSKKIICSEEAGSSECLQRNVGILSFHTLCYCISLTSVYYTLIKGPYY